MAWVVLIVSACAAGMSAFLWARIALEPGLRGRGAARRLSGGRRLMERCVAACEVIGHKPAAIRVASMPAVRGWIARLLPCLRARGIILSELGGFVFASGACVMAGLAGLVVSSSLLGIPVGVTLAIFFFASEVGRRDRETASATVAQMPEVLRALSGALSAGKSLSQAIEYVGRTVSDPLASQFLRTSFEIEGGRSVEDSVKSLCERVDAPGMELLGTALQISQRTGSPLAGLFARTSQMVSSSVALRRDLAVKTSQARLSAHVVAAMPVAIVCVLVLISADYRAGILTGAGRACLCASALLDILALLIVRSLMKKALT